MRLGILALTFLAFTIWSTTIVESHGYFGFLTLAAREPWGAQMLVDLSLSLAVAWAFLVPDARRHGIPWVPYVVTTLALGSIGVLAYLIHRELRAPRLAAS